MTHLVLIPSYNTGAKLLETVHAARQYNFPVWVVIDGSTDGSATTLQQEAQNDRFRVIVLPENRGKGAAVYEGLRLAAAEGFTHVLTMDADGQHPHDQIPAFMALSQANPGAMILGRPVFDETAPWERIWGRKIANALAYLQTWGSGIGDCLCGFRVYPIAPLREVMEKTRWMRRFDFDPEAAIRLSWKGVRPITHPIPVRYFTPAEGGVSHFRYRRDNILLGYMYLRLLGGFLCRLPRLIANRLNHSSVNRNKLA